MKYQVHTFGCKVNTYDSGLIQKNMNQNGYLLKEQTSDEKPRIHVFNTCAVTAEATKEAVRQIRRLKSKDPFCTVVVTGCGAQVDTGHFENLPGADLVVANSHKSQLPFIIEQFFKGNLTEKVFKSNIFKKEDPEIGGGEEASHTRVFLKIQDGCNSFCTYCIIPYARGKSRSIPVQYLVDRVNEFYASGVREVVLTGVHIGDYEDEVRGQKLVLEDLVENLLLKTKMPRFRLSSLEPVELTDRLLALYRDSRMCPHFHMSIQSANTDVLHHMKRKYTQEDVKNALMNIQHHVPGAFVGMDVIVGFPTETHEQFEDTYLTLANLPWSRIHVFPYSERPGTRATQMTETVPLRERQIRAERLRTLSQMRFDEEALKQVGKSKSVMVLKKPARGCQGLTEDYWPVQLNLDDNHSFAGKIIPVSITAFNQNNHNRMEGHLIGEVSL